MTVKHRVRRRPRCEGRRGTHIRRSRDTHIQAHSIHRKTITDLLFEIRSGENDPSHTRILSCARRRPWRRFQGCPLDGLLHHHIAMFLSASTPSVLPRVPLLIGHIHAHRPLVLLQEPKAKFRAHIFTLLIRAPCPPYLPSTFPPPPHVARNLHQVVQLHMSTER
jgi:hypothetical protein